MQIVVTSGVFVQSPVSMLHSSAVQLRPSLQVIVTSLMHPAVTLQVSVVQALLSSQAYELMQPVTG